MKRITALLLSLLMVATLIPAMAITSAAEDDLSTVTEGPIVEIYNDNSDDESKTTFASLIGTTLAENTTYKLMEDIDLGGKELDGSAYITFAKGVIFDGQGHSVTGFSLVGGKQTALFNAQTGNSTANVTLKDVTFGSKSAPIAYTHDGGKYDNFVGFALIRATDSATVLTLSGLTAYVNGACKGGAWQEHAVFVGRNWGTLNIEGCTANGTLSGHGFFGAFVGTTKNSKVTITNSTNNVNITADGSGFFGGFIGRIESAQKTVNIIGCTNNGDVTAERATGGFVGEINKNEHLIITDSVNNGKITGTKSIGGAVGLMTLGQLTAKRFTNNADVNSTSGDGDASAILGKAAAATVYITVTECVNYGAIKASNGMAGGVVGKVTATAGSIKITDFLNAGKITSTSAASAGVGIAENFTNGAKVDNSELIISATRLVNLGDVYAKWNTGAVTGWSHLATLIIKDCVSCGSLTTSNKAADAFAKFTAKSEDETAPYADVTAEGNVYVLNADLNSTEATQKTAAEALEILKDFTKGYKVGTYTLNASKNRIVALIPPTVEGAQIKTNTDGTLSIRFIGTVHSLNYKEVGFKITVDGEEKESLRSNTVLSSLIGKNSDGTKEELTATELGSAHIYAIALEGVSKDGAHTIRVVPFSVRTDDTEYTGIGYTLTVTDGELTSAVADKIEVEEDTEEPDDEPAGPVIDTEDEKLFKTYQSNTIAATGNNGVLTSESTTTARYRAILKVQEYGSFKYRLFFSNNIDSTWGGVDNPLCYPDMDTQPYKVTYAKIGTGTSVTDDMSNAVQLTFEGSNEKYVKKNETYWSDAVTLNVPAGQQLIFEWEVSYTLIPSTNICNTYYGAVYDSESNTYKTSSNVPLPDFIGANRGNETRVAFLGDSITMGQGAGTANYKFYAAQIAEALGKDISSWNLGLGYARANDLLKSNAWLEKAKQNDVVVICLGVNDINSGIYEGAGSKNSRTADEVYEDIRQIAAALEEAGCKVILMSTPPFRYWSTDRSAACLEVGQRLEALATERGYGFFDTVAVWGTEGNESLSKYPASSNDYHPNAEGCTALAEAFISAELIDIPKIESDIPIVDDEDGSDFGPIITVLPS
ncbi:MAG: hypothetical protein IJ011_01800 [Clostridia bacterium]|nr:hypothetical protein [Clostridia bacterium]